MIAMDRLSRLYLKANIPPPDTPYVAGFKKLVKRMSVEHLREIAYNEMTGEQFGKRLKEIFILYGEEELVRLYDDEHKTKANKAI